MAIGVEIPVEAPTEELLTRGELAEVLMAYFNALDEA